MSPKRMAAEVTFMPPPVEPGAAPMNIMTMVRRIEELCMDPVSTEASPAVLADVIWNSAPMILSPTSKPLSVPFHSSSRYSAPPASIMNAVVLTTI